MGLRSGEIGTERRKTRFLSCGEKAKKRKRLAISGERDNSGTSAETMYGREGRYDGGQAVPNQNQHRESTEVTWGL